MKRSTPATLAMIAVLASCVAGVGVAQAASATDASVGIQGTKSPEAGLSKVYRSARSLTTGFADFHFTSPDDSLRRDILDTSKKLNADTIRLYVNWRSIAPSNRPDGFVATNPESPGYDWGSLDKAVRDSRARGMRTILLINVAPAWAEGKNRPHYAPAGTWKPNRSDVADFGTAIAKRYKGQVRDYIFWNEPNLTLWFLPQTGAPGRYRSLLNAFYDAVHRVDDTNRVITAGTAPYGGGKSNGQVNVPPLEFWRKVMCVKDNRKLSPMKCPTKAKFDVLAHHPINVKGGPLTSAVDDDDISTPDLKNLVSVLRAAEKAGHVKPAGRRPVWATELWWETKPQDPLRSNPSLALQARWYQQALYLLWKQGASLVLFYQVRDDVYDGVPGLSSWESGVQLVDGTPKPSSRAVEFPFVADRKSKRKVLLWGKAPRSGVLKVMDGKKRVTKVKIKAGNVFTKTVRLRGKHGLRAKVGNVKSLTWRLK